MPMGYVFGVKTIRKLKVTNSVYPLKAELSVASDLQFWHQR